MINVCMKRFKVRVHTFCGEIQMTFARFPDELWWLGSPPGSLWTWIEWLEDFESYSIPLPDTNCSFGQWTWKWCLEVFWIMKMHLDLLYDVFRRGLNDWFGEILQGEGDSTIRPKMHQKGEIARKRRKLVLCELWCSLWRALDLYL